MKGKFFGLYGGTSCIRVFYWDDHCGNLWESRAFGRFDTCPCFLGKVFHKVFSRVVSKVSISANPQ